MVIGQAGGVADGHRQQAVLTPCPWLLSISQGPFQGVSGWWLGHPARAPLRCILAPAPRLVPSVAAAGATVLAPLSSIGRWYHLQPSLHGRPHMGVVWGWDGAPDVYRVLDSAAYAC
jgi:hypothetical protein